LQTKEKFGKVKSLDLKVKDGEDKPLEAVK